MAVARPLVAGNWKMHGLRASLDALSVLRSAVETGRASGTDLLVCPPFTLLTGAAERLQGSSIALGAQDCAPGRDKPATGDIAAEMIRDAGASHVIVGHSERRRLRGDTDATVRRKAQAALQAGLTVILCVGETRDERDDSETLEVIRSQVEASLPDEATAGRLILAYEPVWAIGTGVTPTPDDIAEVHGLMRGLMASRFGAEATGLRLLYGGSVKGSNAREVAAVRDVDGALVGGASLTPEDFLAVADAFG